MNAEIENLDREYNNAKATYNKLKFSCNKEDSMELEKLTEAQNELARINGLRRQAWNNIYSKKMAA